MLGKMKLVRLVFPIPLFALKKACCGIASAGLELYAAMVVALKSIEARIGMLSRSVKKSLASIVPDTVKLVI